MVGDSTPKLFYAYFTTPPEVFLNNPETEQTKNAGSFENIRLLNVMNQKDSDLSSLALSIAAARKTLDAILATERERIKNSERVRREEQKREKEADKDSAEVVTTEAEVVLPQDDPKKEEKVEKTEPQVKKSRPQESEVSTAAPPAKQPPRQSAVTKKPEKIDNIRTRSFDITPSYIRGKLTPSAASAATAPPRQGSRGDGKFSPRPGIPGARPGAPVPARPSVPAPLKPGATPPPSSASALSRKSGGDKKKAYQKPGDDKKGMTKRTLIRKGFISENFDEDRVGLRRLKNKRKLDAFAPISVKIEKAVITTENLTVKILSEKIGKTAQEIIKKLMLLGIMTTINGVVDFPTMELVANELGVELELKLDKSQEEILEEGHDIADSEDDLIKRPPVITVMGHVDHGKTSLLDRIRKTNVASGEAGGITQHIGAYSVTVREQKITFLDTPGHEAFSEMRARGAQVTDIAVLVVAADDGIMPQTVEAINHAKAASVPVIVAVNKIDKPGADIAKIRERLTEHGLVDEQWGGETMIVPISAKTGEGIDKLLESILLLAEVNNYRANPARLAKASVIEARVDKGRGPIANVIVQNGTLRVGDNLVSGTAVAKVRAMTDDRGRAVKEAGPSMPVSILGFTEVPGAGDAVLAVADEKQARQVASERVDKFRAGQIAPGQKFTLDDLLKKTGETQLKPLNVIIKADVQGSVEALRNSLARLQNEEARVSVVGGGVGAVTKSDILLAEVSKAIIIGFNVRPDTENKALAENASVEIRTYRIIYEAIEDMERMLKGMLTPKFKETVTGRAEVRNVFKITGSGIIAGSYVTSGKIFRNSKVRVLRAGEVVFEGALKGLKRFKEDVKDVAEGYECGISVEGFSDVKELDIVEAYSLEQIN